MTQQTTAMLSARYAFSADQCRAAECPGESYSALLVRLSRQSVIKHFDAYADIDWESPDFRIDPTDSRWELADDDALGSTAWYRALPQPVRARIGLHMIASFMQVGRQFESVLKRGLLEFAAELPNGSPEFRYVYHEVIEEGQHALMFQEFVNRTGLDIQGLPSLLRVGARRIIHLARCFPELFFLFVLGGEDPIDHVQRTALLSNRPIHPLLKRIMQIHVTEEARHLCFARQYLKQHVGRLGWQRRVNLAVQAPVLLAVMAQLMMRPSRRIMREYSIPPPVVAAAYTNNPVHRARTIEALHKVRTLCCELGIVIPRLWKALGIWEAPNVSRVRTLLTPVVAVILGVLLGVMTSVPAEVHAQLTGKDSTLNRCERAVAGALGRCFKTVAKRTRGCYLKSGQACTTDDVRITRSQHNLERRVTKACSTPGILTTLGYGALLTPASLVARLQATCIGDVQTLTARTFGGPQGAVLASATPETLACLMAAHQAGADLIKKSFRLQGNCIRRAHRGGTCDQSDLAADIVKRDERATETINANCPSLFSLIGLDTATFLARAHAQDRCMVAAALGDPGPLTLDCGPRPSVPVPPRGQWVHVILDGNVWGTLCAGGGPYAFWLRLPPAGADPSKVLIHLDSGGVCIFESDCQSAADNGLFEGLQDWSPNGPSGGYFSTDPGANPFAEWTMIALPYCTQDLHIGGGVDTVFPTLTVHRYGAINLRASLRYLRDVLWAELNATTPEGYRPDRLQVLFSGVSAGAFGVTYNYHYLLDDLRWIHTTAAPDSGLGLDNGELLGIRTLGTVVFPTWNTIPFQPPYCLAGDCAVVPEAQAIMSARLKAVPDQQLLNLSNQRDNTQVSTTYFANETSWRNALRAAYCANQGLNGIHSFLPASSTSMHGLVTVTSRFSSLTADGVVLRDFLSAAITDPDAVVDRVEAGTLSGDPFPCSID